MSEEKITSKELLNQLTAKHYDGALAAKAEGKPVVWATSICPNELLDAMDLATVYPENHAAAIGARKEAMKFIEHAEGIGYSADICTVADALRVFDELHCLFSGADGCGMVFRIYRSQVHGVQQLVRTDGRRPDHRLSFRLCCKGTVVMLGGQLVQQFF